MGRHDREVHRQHAVEEQRWRYLPLGLHVLGMAKRWPLSWKKLQAQLKLRPDECRNLLKRDNRGRNEPKSITTAPLCAASTAELNALRGRRIRVWWRDENGWFSGRVTDVLPPDDASSTLSIEIAYDDDTTEEHNLDDEVWELLPNDDDGATAAAAGKAPAASKRKGSGGSRKRAPKAAKPQSNTAAALPLPAGLALAVPMICETGYTEGDARAEMGDSTVKGVPDKKKNHASADSRTKVAADRRAAKKKALPKPHASVGADSQRANTNMFLQLDHAAVCGAHCKKDCAKISFAHMT